MQMIQHYQVLCTHLVPLHVMNEEETIHGYQIDSAMRSPGAEVIDGLLT